jgi:hypothetical protein
MHEIRQYGTTDTDTQIRRMEEAIQERQTAWYYILWRDAVRSVPGLSLIVPLTKSSAQGVKSRSTVISFLVADPWPVVTTAAQRSQVANWDVRAQVRSV